MKHLLFALLLGSLALTGCDKDDTADFSSIVGQWKLVELYTDNGMGTSSGFGVSFSFTYTFYGKDFTAVTTFSENPNTFITDGTYTAVTTTTIDGVSNTTEVTAPEYGIPGEWAIDGDTFTQILSGQTTEFKILELSEEKFRIRYDLDVTFTDNGVTTTDKATVYSSYERL